MPQSTYSQAEVDSLLATRDATFAALSARVSALEKATVPTPPVDPPPVTPPATGTFKVLGANILDPAGKTFVPFGFNVGAPAAFDWKGIGKGHVADLQAWGGNAIRLTLFVTTDIATWSRRSSAGYPALLQDVADIVAEYTAKKVVVIIEAHDATSNAAQATQFWGDVVKAYKTNPYVWVNYQNEYGWSDANDWLTHQKAWLAEVRAAGYTGPFVADVLNTGQDAGWEGAPKVYSGYGATLLAADPLKNVVFSHHNYGGLDDGMGSGPYYDAVRKANLAMIVGEFGQTTNATPTAGTDAQNKNGVNSVCTLARSKGVGALAWHGTHGDNYSVKQSGGPFWEGGNNAGLSDYGTKFWKACHPG